MESRSVLTSRESELVDQYERSGGGTITADVGDWQAQLHRLIESPSLKVSGPATVRAVVRDQPGRTIVHVYNLNIERISPFEDQVAPATGVTLTVRVPTTSVGEVQLLTVDENTGPARLVSRRADGSEAFLEIGLPQVSIGAILVIDHGEQAARLD